MERVDVHRAGVVAEYAALAERWRKLADALSVDLDLAVHGLELIAVKGSPLEPDQVARNALANITKRGGNG